MTCETCKDAGYVIVHVSDYSIDVPCPDCPAGDAK